MRADKKNSHYKLCNSYTYDRTCRLVSQSTELTPVSLRFDPAQAVPVVTVTQLTQESSQRVYTERDQMEKPVTQQTVITWLGEIPASALC